MMGLGIGLGVGMSPPAASGPALASVVRVEVDGTSNDTLNWWFSQQIFAGGTCPALEADDGTGMASPDVIGNSSLFIVSAIYTGKTFTPGNAWQKLTSPDPDITSAGGFVVPESGTTD